MSSGRYAPSPTSDLHIGNLRTAVLAWLFARASGRAFRLRIEDLDIDRVRAASGVAERQLTDMAALGLTFDPPTVRQSERLAAYAMAAAQLSERVYECYCTRREIAEAASAPHGDGHRPYPGTCRDLSEVERSRRRAVRPAALRIRADGAVQEVTDVLHGRITATVDDFVLRRGDGTWAYNFVVVVDDLAMGIDQVVRADDLLSSSPRQAWLTRQLGGSIPEYVHVPLVTNPAGVRLAKRDGAVSLADLAANGLDAQWVLDWIARSIRLADADERVTLSSLLDRFDPAALPRAPTIFQI